MLPCQVSHLLLFTTKMKKILLAISILGVIGVPLITNGLSTSLPYQGGTGTATIPSYGQVLVGNGSGIYTPQATSTIGLPTFNGNNYFTGYNSFTNLFATNATTTNATTTGILYAGLLKLPLVTAPTYTPGLLFYESYGSLDSLSFYGTHSGTTLNIGKELWKDVRNCNSGSTITNGTAVYLTGTVVGQVPCVLPAYASTFNTANVAGVATEDILDNNDGIISTFGIINGLDTSGLTEGSNLYLATTTTGALNSYKNMTTTKPNSPYYNVMIGEVDYSHPTLGKLELRIDFPRDLSDNKDFKLTSPTSGQILMYDSSIPAWKNVATTSFGTIAVPYGGTGSTTLTGILKGNGTSAIQTAIPNTDYTPAVITTPFDLINGSSSNTAQRFPSNTSATLKFLSSAGDGVNPTTMSWQTIPALGSYTYFFTNTVDGSYLDMVNSTSTPTTYSTAYTSITTDTLLQSWVTPTGFPNLTTIPSGIWKFHIDANKTIGTKNVSLYASVYKLSGVTESLLFTTQNSEFITSSSLTNYQEIEWEYYDVTPITLLNTDRIIVKIYASPSGSGSDPSGNIYYMNSTQARVEFPPDTFSVDNFVPYTGATKNLNLGLFNSSSTQSTISDKLWLSSLGTPAGSVLAVDPNGLVIATSSASGITSFNGLTTSSQTLATTTNDGGWGFSSSVSTHTLNIPQAKSTNPFGLLSATDWSTFNSKENALTFLYPLTRLVNTISLSDMATTSVTCSGATSCTSFNVLGSSPITISSTDNTASTTLLSDNNTFSGSNKFGTIAAGTWNGTAIGTQYGGTGQNFSASTGLISLNNGVASAVATSSLLMDYFPSFTYATTTWSGTTTIPLAPAYNAETWKGAKCFTDVGTLDVVFNDGTNNMNLFNASTTVGEVTLSTNNSFTASEKRYVSIGNPATSPTKISCSVKINR